MPSAALAQLEAVLRSKHLDRTLTSLLPWHTPPTPAAELMATGVGAFDAQLSGGFSRGEISEIVGAPTSGRTTLVLQALAAATRRGEFVALVDALDRLDVSSAAATGMDLDRVLWVRGRVTAHPGPCRDANSRALEHVLKALTLVLRAGICELVVLDLADAPSRAIRDLPLTTWLRLHRMIEGSRTACLLVSTSHLWRSAGGMTVEMTAEAWSGEMDVPPPTHVRLFTGLTIRAQVTRARVLSHVPLCVPVSATCA